jgi:Tol biopolymer transport system component
MVRKLITLIAAGIAIAIVAVPAAEAGFPGMNGRIAYNKMGDYNKDIHTIDPITKDEDQLTTDPADDYDAAVSPDGTKIAFASERSGCVDIYVMNADGSGQTQLTETGFAIDWSPAWSPDGTKIAFTSYRDGNAEIYVMKADGSNETRLTDNPATDHQPAWSPDGTEIAFSSDRDGDEEIYTLSVLKPAVIQQLTSNSARDTAPNWSPDGTMIAFHSDQDAPANHIYTMNANGSSQLLLTLGLFPAWSPDGTKLTFARDQGELGWNPDIYTINVDGSNEDKLTSAVDLENNPDWGVFVATVAGGNGLGSDPGNDAGSDADPASQEPGSRN